METVLRPLDQTRVISIEGHWGRDPRAAAPVAPDVANPISPTAQYGYDAALGLWVPVNVSGGFIVEKFSELIANLLAGVLAQTSDLTDDADATLGQLGTLLDLVNTRLGGNQSAYLWQSLLSSISGLGFRKILQTDAGAYTAPAAGGNVISFTGVNLLGRTPFVAWNLTERRLHLITTIVDPVPPAVGTITLETPVGAANTVWLIPYLDVPHAWNAALDATQTVAVTGDPPRINGPATFLAVTAAVIGNGTTQYVLPSAMYARQGIQIVWTCAGATTLQFNVYGKVDDAAWAAAGTIPQGYRINSWFQHTPAGVAFGAPPIGTATANIIEARLQDAGQFNSIAIEMVATNSAGNSTVTGTYRLAGGTA